MIEKFPSFESHDMPTIFRVEGAQIPYETMKARLEMTMERLPRLKVDYFARTMQFKDNESMSKDDFTQVCQDLSLRPEPFIEWDDEYFAGQFDDLVRIARHRGSH